jgi:hypothetical protein
MKSFTINKIHVVLFESGPFSFSGSRTASYQINELLDEEGKTHFSYGPIGHAADMVYCAGVTHDSVNKMLQKASNLFEAKAALIELIIENQKSLEKINEDYSVFGLFRKKSETIDFKPLMRELKDLPLLIGFFKGGTTLKIFEEVLKNG